MDEPRWALEGAPASPSWAAEVADLVPVDAWRDGAPYDWRAVTLDGVTVQTDDGPEHPLSASIARRGDAYAMEYPAGPDALRRAVERVRAKVARG